MLKGTVPLPLTKFDKFNKPVFSPRRWDWVDPYKDVQAIKESLALGLTTHSEVLSEKGKDLRDVWIQYAHEQQLAAELKIKVATFTKPQAPAPPPKATESEDEDA
jgi:capsid protein